MEENDIDMVIGLVSEADGNNALDTEKIAFLREVLQKAFESKEQDGSVLVSEFDAENYGQELINLLIKAEMCWVEGTGSDAKVILPALITREMPNWMKTS